MPLLSMILSVLLAYHTVENIGIILMGVGVGMIGIATHHPLLATIGLLGGFVPHVKSMPYLRACYFLVLALLSSVYILKIWIKWAGLGKLMPYTALAFFDWYDGDFSVTSLKPVFVSEWFIYQSLLTMGRQGDLIMSLGSIICGGDVSFDWRTRMYVFC